MNTVVTIPLKVRIVAYVLTLLPFDGLAAWLISTQHLSASAAALIGLALGTIHTISGVFALAHLSIPDGSASDNTGLSQSATAYMNSVSYDLPGYISQDQPSLAATSSAMASSMGNSGPAEALAPAQSPVVPPAVPEPAPVIADPASVPPAPVSVAEAPVVFPVAPAVVPVQAPLS